MGTLEGLSWTRQRIVISLIRVFYRHYIAAVCNSFKIYQSILVLFMGMKNEGAFRKLSNSLCCVVGWCSTVSAPGRNFTSSVGFCSERDTWTYCCMCTDELYKDWYIRVLWGSMPMPQYFVLAWLTLQLTSVDLKKKSKVALWKANKNIYFPSFSFPLPLFSSCLKKV